MAFQDHLLRMSRYHRWASLKTFEAVAKVSERSGATCSGLPCDSMCGTIHHMLLADVLWMRRIAGDDSIPEGTVLPLKTPLEQLWQDGSPVSWTALSPPLEVMKSSQMRMCDAWTELISARDEASLSAAFTYSNTRGKSMTKPLGPVLAHVFNHGTHHRGQLSAVIFEATGEYPKLDLVYFLDEDLRR